MTRESTTDRTEVSRSRASAREDGAINDVMRTLRSAAIEGRTVTYGELAARIDARNLPPRSRQLMRVLSAACDLLDSRPGVMHASLVVRADSGMPGGGYFVWLEQSGHSIEDREAFWRAEVERVWASYGDEL